MSKRLLLASILAVYCAILIKVVAFKDVEIRTAHLLFKLGPDYVVGHSNFVPFKTNWSYLRGDKGWLFGFLNLGGNIIPFVPVGFFVPLLIRKMTWPASLALGAGVGLAMEIIEVVFHVGRFDVDDITLNAMGVVLGYGMFTVLRRWRSAALRPG